MEITFRTLAKAKDIKRVEEIVRSTGFFNEKETDLAIEFIEEHVYDDAEYHFIFAEIDDITVGYCSYKYIDHTKYSYDLDWLVVDDEYRNKGIGKLLVKELCNTIKKLGGHNIYAETSGTSQYLPTRKFYLNNGFIMEAVIKDFYDQGDDKVIFTIHV